MGDGPDAVDMRERPGGRAARAAHQRPREVSQMVPRVPERPFQRVAQLQSVAVFTAEHQRDDEPIVRGPHAPVGADHAVERAVRPAETSGAFHMYGTASLRSTSAA